MTIEKAREISAIDESALYAAMAKDDALEVTIKGAIFIEHQLIGFVEERVVSTKALNRMNLSFEDRVNLAVALGLRETLQPPLKAMASIRNKFAHRLDASVSKSDMDAFRNTFTPEDKAKLELVYQRTRKKTNSKKPAKFSSLTELEQFTHYVVSLRGILVVERIQKP